MGCSVRVPVISGAPGANGWVDSDLTIHRIQRWFSLHAQTRSSRRRTDSVLHVAPIFIYTWARYLNH